MKNITGKIGNLLWGLFVLLLPLTSVPIIVRLAHSDVVAAPSALLLPFLLLVVGVPVFVSRGKLPDNTSLFILFVLAALAATAVSFFYQIPDYKGLDTFRPAISAVLTLLIGFCFYLVSLLWHNSEKNLEITFKLLNISGAVVCLWTMAQAVCWYRFQRYPEWMKNIQFTLSVGSLYRQRFVGFTLEPSWLAHQLNLLYLPFWFAASVTGYSAFHGRVKFITVERILFAAGVLVLFLTLSRVGLAAFLLTVAFALLVFVHFLVKRTAEKFSGSRRRLITVFLYLSIFILLLGAAFLLLWLLTKLDFRMAGLFSIQAEGRSDPILYIAEKLSLAARFVYWDGGFSIFNAHPLLGVGLGHAGFYLPGLMNDYAFRLVEVRNLLYRSNTLLTIKSLWIRVLAETGIVGFIFFFLWYLHSLLGNFCGLSSKNIQMRTAAWLGCFALIAFLFEGFSLDTFALPYIWFSVGLSVAAQELD